MAKGFIRSAKTYVKNLGKHAYALVRGRESAREALEQVSKDTRRLKYTLNPEVRRDRKKALKFVERARRYYNQGSYENASETLHKAIECDPRCALAYTYLGYTHFKSSKFDEAVLCWKRAIEIDPDSSAAGKARHSLQRMAAGKRETLEALEQDIRHQQGYF